MAVVNIKISNDILEHKVKVHVYFEQ